jgi:lipopolysaccharide/colanic/teichoic acid biosynthesis glycosyltransferase/glycosyltransferase involved in cell wall biosynthesis
MFSSQTGGIDLFKYHQGLKPIIDFFLSLLGLFILFPVFILLIIAIKLDSKGPALFQQRRIGKGKREFQILKFRTMRLDTPKDLPTHLLSNPDLYITKVGKFLRKTSLDELPQILNVLKGEMSLIGPRPALWNQDDLVAERDKYGANDLVPGLTGWAQVNGRDELPISVKAAFDGYYAQEFSLGLDIKIFLQTIWSVVAGKGVVEGGTGRLGLVRLLTRSEMAKQKSITENINIWTFHHYATLPNLNGHNRPYNFGKIMKKRGMNMTVFVSSYLHFSDLDIIKDNSKYLINNEFEVPFVFVKTPASKDGGKDRVKNMYGFYKGLFHTSKEYAGNYGKPDIIIASSPHPLAMIAGIKIAKKYQVPCICEVRDLWPEAIFTVTNLKEKSIMGKILSQGEHWIYKKADAIIFTKEGDTDYLKEQKWDKASGGDLDLSKCYYINNGVNIEAYRRSIETDILDDSDLISDSFKVIYCGAIRLVNNVGNILDAAALLSDYPDIQFLIFGDGDQTARLAQRIQDEGLTNVKLKGFVEKKYIPYILSKSSVNLLNYSQSLYNWSRGNSSNKLFEYMASGKPIIATVKMGYSIIDKYQCGFSLERDTPQELATAILKVRNLPGKEYEKLALNAEVGAKDFDYQFLTQKLIAVIDMVMSKNNDN